VVKLNKTTKHIRIIQNILSNYIIINIKMENSKNDLANKLKEDIRLIFSQLKTGCFRKHCYNIYCAKGNGIIYLTQISHK
jgi:hypothetical protein